MKSRRGQSHTKDSHRIITIDGKSFTFDESANHYYDLALKNGLLEMML
jgi:hypothetical protein